MAVKWRWQSCGGSDQVAVADEWRWRSSDGGSGLAVAMAMARAVVVGRMVAVAMIKGLWRLCGSGGQVAVAIEWGWVVDWQWRWQGRR